jgi:hypothetical protein
VKKVSEYRQHAEECRELARSTTNPEHLRQLDEMAKAWEMLANERAKKIAKPNGSKESPDPETMS